MQPQNAPFQTSRRDFIKLAGLSAGAAVIGPSLQTPASVSASATAPARVPPSRVGKWLPSDQAILDRWLAGHIQATAANPKPLHPVIAEFKALIESDPQIYMYFHQMFEQVPHTVSFQADPAGGRRCATTNTCWS